VEVDVIDIDTASSWESSFSIKKSCLPKIVNNTGEWKKEKMGERRNREKVAGGAMQTLQTPDTISAAGRIISIIVPVLCFKYQHDG